MYCVAISVNCPGLFNDCARRQSRRASCVRGFSGLSGYCLMRFS